MFMFSSCLSFLNLLLVSIFLGLSSPSLFVTWVALELNLLSFLIILSENQKDSVFLMLKYFIVQSIGSGFFLVAALWSLSFFNEVPIFVISLALLWKMGAAPFHGWMISLVNPLKWDLFFILSTVQKVLPLFLLIQMFSVVSNVYILLGVLMALVGGLKETNLKKLMVYSSLLTISWILAPSLMYEGLLYLLTYSLSFYLLMSFMYSSGTYVLESASHHFSDNSNTAVLVILLLSFIGMPPFIGFYPKLIILSTLLNGSLMLMSVILILGSAGFIIIYLQFCVSNLELSQPYMLFSMSVPSSLSLAVMITLFGGLVFMFLCV